MKKPVEKLMEQLKTAECKVNVTHFRCFVDLQGTARIRSRRDLREAPLKGVRILPHGGRVVARVTMKDGRVFETEASCSLLDNFCGRTGTAIALGRAVAALRKIENSGGYAI